MFFFPGTLLAHHDGASTQKTLVTPVQRRAIRSDFPRLMQWNREWPDPFESFVWSDTIIRREIEKAANMLSSPGRITIAYPHKASGLFTGKLHRLVGAAHEFANDMRKLMPDIEWVVADGICERKHLNRVKNRNQTIVKTLTQAQEFFYLHSDQKEPLPFIESGNSGEAFIMFDDVFCQGKTAAAMINFIEANGGYVLAAFGKHFVNMPRNAERYLQQKSYAQDLKQDFSNAAFNTGRIPELASVFFKAAQATSKHPPATPEDCLRQVENALNTRGHSLTTLTNGECSHFGPYLEGYWSFTKRVPGVPYNAFLRKLSGGPYRENPSPR